ncbi:MAG: hypothetical protein C0593_07140 [Marinilabiliales bacterium]|nr:MAG: hypothetical protein C0593_07140 [Marinilabiliales bacterium]
MKPYLLNKTTLLSTLVLFLIVVFTLQSCKEENQPPEVQISSPGEGDIFSIGDEIVILANADDPDGDIKEVRFYVNDEYFFSSDEAPYRANLNTEQYKPGIYELMATAIDEQGEEASDIIEITLQVAGMAPLADFTASVVQGDAPLSVSFIDQSANEPTIWIWNFGDGNTSQEQNPEHLYENAGMYDVKLISSNEFGTDTIFKSNYIIVNNPVFAPSVFFTANPENITPGQEVVFSDLTVNNPDYWRWDFGDGTISENRNPVHTYNEYGSYTVSLYASNAAGEDSLEIENLITVLDYPVASFKAYVTVGYFPFEVDFYDQSEWATQWHWDFGDGQTSEAQNPTHIFQHEGEYDISLTVSNALGDNLITEEKYIRVIEYCPSVMTDIDNNEYITVLIQDQCWMAEDLRVTHYPNGDAIPHIPEASLWSLLDDNNFDDAYCFYENDPDTDYGALYTFAAVIADNWTRDNENRQGICPDGWHIPTDGEWEILFDIYSGGRYKEAGYDHWMEPNRGATNYTGFTALPGGERKYFDGSFEGRGEFGFWWSATEEQDRYAWGRSLLYNSVESVRSKKTKSRGYSVRCVQNMNR